MILTLLEKVDQAGGGQGPGGVAGYPRQAAQVMLVEGIVGGAGQGQYPEPFAAAEQGNGDERTRQVGRVRSLEAGVGAAVADQHGLAMREGPARDPLPDLEAGHPAPGGWA